LLGWIIVGVAGRRGLDPVAGAQVMPGRIAGKGEVARGVGRPKKPGGEGKHVRLNPDLVAKARIIALRRGYSVGDYLSRLLETPVNRDYQRVLKELTEENRTE
jgi:hypothetical protein